MADRDFDTEKFSQPVTRAELWMLLTKVDVLVHVSRSLAIAASRNDAAMVEELRERYKVLDDEFAALKDRLVFKDLEPEA